MQHSDDNCIQYVSINFTVEEDSTHRPDFPFLPKKTRRQARLHVVEAPVQRRAPSGLPRRVGIIIVASLQSWQFQILPRRRLSC